jgi:NADP-dependent 3-hydroxy acid dehydrogenase YdfG
VALHSPMYNTELSITSLFSVRGKIALVTGGATGIGKMIASGLVSNGAKVYIASRKEKALQEVGDQRLRRYL